MRIDLQCPFHEKDRAKQLGARWDRLDGIVVPGGIDVDPAYYRAPRHELLGRLDPARKAFETLAGRGVPAAQYNLAVMHLRGEMPRSDAKQAARLMASAAQGGFGIHFQVTGQAGDHEQQVADFFLALGLGGVRAHQHATGSACDVARHADRNVETEGDRIGESELHLIQIPARSEDSEIGNDPASWPDQGYGLFRRVLAFLVKPLHRSQLVAGAEKRLDRFLGEVAMTC